MTASIDEGRAPVDTNIVVYAYDADDPTKHQAAKGLLKTLSDADRLVYSAQVFNEFCCVVMRPRRAPTPLPPERIAEILRDLAATGEVVPLTAVMTLRALEAMPQHFQHGRDVEGVRFVNPFVSET
jgi:predicted nucleic acid-binding protein